MDYDACVPAKDGGQPRKLKAENLNVVEDRLDRRKQVQGVMQVMQLSFFSLEVATKSCSEIASQDPNPDPTIPTDPPNGGWWIELERNKVAVRKGEAAQDEEMLWHLDFLCISTISTFLCRIIVGRCQGEGVPKCT